MSVDEANLVCERIEGMIEAEHLDASVDVSADGFVVVRMAPEVADRFWLVPDPDDPAQKDLAHYPKARALADRFEALAKDLEDDPQDAHPEYLLGAVTAWRAAADEVRPG